MSDQHTPRHPRPVALVYRARTGCRQYPFFSADELQAWAARHPYRNETLTVHPILADGKFGEKAVLPAAEAADHVRKASGKPEGGTQ